MIIKKPINILSIEKPVRFFDACVNSFLVIIVGVFNKGKYLDLLRRKLGRSMTWQFCILGLSLSVIRRKSQTELWKTRRKHQLIQAMIMFSR